ncbi:HOOK family protein [Brugia pahangi]
MLQLYNNGKEEYEKSEEEFWKEPLGAWIKDCIIGSDALLPEVAWRIEKYRGRILRFSELCDGFLFSLLFVFVEPNTLNLIIMRGEENSLSDTTTSLRRFLVLLENIREFYRKQLNKLIVMPLPDLLTIVRNPYADGCKADVNNVLLLLLGCAVQGEQRGKFIERIKRMENELQTALLNQIKKVAEEGDCVLNIQALELISEDHQKAVILAHLESIMKERDMYANRLYEMSGERESDENSTTTGSSSVSSEVIRTTKVSEKDRIPSPSAMERHANVELASAKAELRKLRNMMEEREEMIAELKDEAEAREVNILKMQQERLELVKDARAAKDYRDELECLQHKLANYDKLEADNIKLKEKLSDLDFFKSRVTQLKEENELMQESCSILEDQLEQCQRKVSSHIDMEIKLADYQYQIKQYLADITKDHEKIEHLLVENGRLERELKSEKQKSLALERKVESINEKNEHCSREDFESLGSQMADDDRKRILELELENRKLRTKLENAKNCEELGEVHAKLLRTEIELSEKKEECGVLGQQVQEFQMTLSQVTSQYQKTCDLCNTLVMERDLAQQNLQEARKKFSDFQNEQKNDLTKAVSELQETLEAKEEIINCLREAKIRADEELRKAFEREQISETDMGKLKSKLQETEQIAHNLEKQKELLENERNIQKAISERLEGHIEENRLKIMNMENIQKKLESCERAVMESRSRVNELESENRQLNQQLELELKKMDRLREDLVAAKSRCSDLISRLRSICASIQLNGGKCEVEMVQSTDDDDGGDNDERIITIIDDVIMKALTAARREADLLRLQQHTQIAELNDLKEDIERLRRSESDLNGSDDRLRQLTTENRNIKEQVFLLQERIREMQQANSLKCSEVTSLKRELEELQQTAANRNKLHTELAKLQVSLRNLQLQEELLRQDNAEMQKQLKICEEEKLATKTDFESLQSMHNALLMDHDRLQTLHDMLSADYDRAKYDNTLLNIKLKNHKGTTEEVLNERRQFEELKLTLAEERERRDREVKIMRSDMMALRNNYEQIRKDNISMARNAQLSEDELRKLRFAEQNQRTIKERLTAQIEDLQRKLQARNLEITELLQKIELFAHLNKTLEEESRILDRQVNHLLAENQDLLSRILNDKDTYQNVQKDFQERVTLQEKLSSLRSHKEQLEGKIMGQYQTLNNRKEVTKEKPASVDVSVKTLIPKNLGESSNIFSAEKFMYRGSTEENNTYPAKESLTPVASKRDSPLTASTNGHCSFLDDQPCSSSDELTLINRNCDLRQNGNGRTQANSDCKDSSTHSPRIFMRNVFHAEYSSMRRTIPFNERSVDVISLNGSERGVDVPSLSPRPLSRSNSVGRSLHSRLLPPTYEPKNCTKQPTVNNKPPPPPYKGRTTPTKRNAEFSPKETSTPKLEHSEFVLCQKDEERSVIRDKAERNEKVISVYENVNHSDISIDSEIGTVWYEYGCV